MMFTAMAFMNSALAVLVAVYSFAYCWKNRKHGITWLWIKIAIGFIGLYWCFLYGYMGLCERQIIDLIAFNHSWMRPGVMITMAVLAAGAIQRNR